MAPSICRKRATICSGVCFFRAIFQLLSYQIFSHFTWYKFAGHVNRLPGTPPRYFSRAFKSLTNAEFGFKRAQLDNLAGGQGRWAFTPMPRNQPAYSLLDAPLALIGPQLLTLPCS